MYGWRNRNDLVVHYAGFSSFRGREIGNEKLIGILDLQHISYKNIDARGLITGFQFLQVSLYEAENKDGVEVNNEGNICDIPF